MIRFIFSAKSIWVALMLSISIFLNAQITPTDGIVYVTPDGTGNGSSWNSPTSDLHNAIQAAGVQKVFVAVGNYNVGSTSFIMKNGVAIYGGFDPGAGITDLTHNRIMPNAANTNGSILNGENTRPVIWNVFNSGTAMNNTAVLDGFTVINGSYSNGAGIRNIYASPTLRNLVIRGNNATSSGAGIYNDNSSPDIYNTVISGNIIIAPFNQSGMGAGIYNNTNSAPTIVNTTIANNTITGIGANPIMVGAGVASLGGAAPKIYNSIIWNNQKNGVANTAGADIENISATLTLKNSITQSYTTGNTGDNNKVGVNPLFVGVADYRLQGISPAFNAGSNALFPGLDANTKDLAGNPRLGGSSVDMGAYEYTLLPDNNGIIYVRNGFTGKGTSWADATGDLHNAIHATNVQKVFVAVGNYNVGDHSFIMKNNVEIYGGFDPANGITALAHNRIMPNAANTQGSVLNGQNVRPVVWNEYSEQNQLYSTAVLDGFTVMNGLNTGLQGAGIYNFGASPTLRNLVIRNNVMTSLGAALYNVGSSTIVTNVSIINNQGRGVVNSQSTPQFTNVLISGNTGVGVYNWGNTYVHIDTYTNVTIANNGLPFQASAYSHFKNSILWDDIIGYDYGGENNLIKGNVSTANGNLNATEIEYADIFKDPSNGDYTLKFGSPAINAGDNTLFTGLNEDTKDLAGNARVFNYANNGMIDMGAYESSFEPLTPDANGIIYVKETYSGTGSGKDWDNATSDLHNAIHTDGVQKVFVAVGNYNVGDHSFIMKNNVAIYGGFDPENGIEDLDDERILPTEAVEGSILNGQNTRPVIWNNNNGLTNTALLDGFTIRNGNAEYGGGIYNQGTYNYDGDMSEHIAPVFNNLVIKNNNSSSRGGGIYNENSNAVFTNIIVKNNTASSFGGGIYNNESAATFTYVTIDGNQADSYGGGLYDQGAVDYFENAYYHSTFEQVTIKNNAASSGGGVYSSSNSSVYTNVLIENNNSDDYGFGGGFYNDYEGSPILTNVQITGNSAYYYGGGFYNNNSSLNDKYPALTNVLIADNTAGEGGGGYYERSSEDAPTILTNVTIANNTPNAIQVNGGWLRLDNSIAFGGVGMDDYDDVIFTSQYSLTEDNTDTSNGNVNAENISLADIFTNPSSGDYTLKEGSPAINAGNNTLFTGLNEDTKDLAGNSRLSGAGIDLGAYESISLTPTNGIIYVKENGTGDGSSWTNATSDLHNAIHTDGVQKVFVAVGNYNVGDHSFIMKNNVAIYGGFDPENGIEDLDDERILPTETVEGSILNGQNTRPVIWNDDNGVNNTAVLDGFTITNGSGSQGGGIYNYYASPTMSNLVIKNNHASVVGGGIYSNFSDNPVINNVIVTQNSATHLAGGIYLSIAPNPIVNNLTVTENTSDDGGGMYINYSTLTLENGMISNNTGTRGGGIHNLGSTTVFNNVKMTGNTGTQGGAVYSTNSNLNLNNVQITGNASTGQGAAVFSDGDYDLLFVNTTVESNSPDAFNLLSQESPAIFYNAVIYGEITGNYTPQYSLVEGNTDFSNGNINASGISVSDIFTDPTNGDYTLKNGSVAVNAGNNDLFTGLDENTLDLAGNARVYDYANGGVIDLGAYESALASITPDANNILYVDINVSGGNGSGNSWENAIPQLADAMKYARQQYDANNTVYDATPLKIYVAKGTYKPMYSARNNYYTVDETIDNAFVMVKNVQIYGGFDPTNGIDDLSDTRIFGENGSILSGDIGTPTHVDDTYHVVVSSDDVASALLDGFTIRDANYKVTSGTFITVNGYPVYRDFGAIYNVRSSPSYVNCLITANYTYTGGGMYNHQQASPTITNCTFINNHTTGTSGGAIYNVVSCSPVIANCTFINNTAGQGGAIYNKTNSSPIISNCSFTNNIANEGGAIYNNASSPIIINSLIANNTAGSGSENGSAIYNEGASSPQLTNVSIANNYGLTAVYSTAGSTTINNSIVLGGISGTYTPQYSLIEGNTDFSNGNINALAISVSDIFTDPANGDYTLKEGSVAINTGNNALYPGLDENTLDLAGNPRLFGTNIDLGAYESTFVPASEHCLYTTTWNGTSWSNGEPDYDTQAIIDGDLVIDYELDACEVVVTANGSLRVLADAILDCDWSVTNLATAADFVVENNGALIQWEEVENTGAITVKRESSPMIRLDYAMWSSPVIGQNLFNFSPETINGVTNYPGSTGRIYVYDGANGYVNPNPFLADTEMISGIGYLYRSPNNFDASIPTVYEGIFTGVPFNGDLSVPTVAGDYTSVGNPYPSNLDADLLFDANSGLNTLYFWVNTPIVEGEYVGNNYATYNLAGGVSNTGEISGEGVPSGIISAGQGFIVSTSNDSIAFNNFMRTDDPTNFFKPSEFERHRFWLNLSDDENIGLNQILIGYMENATMGIDSQIDGKLFGYEGSAIYSLIDDASTGSATKLTIQGRSLPFEDSDVVPIGFRAVESGKFKIELANFDGLFAEGQSIYLKDKKLDLIQDLSIPYEFESEAGTFDNRFEIIYKNDETMGIDDLTVNGILIYKNQNFIEIASKESQIDSVEIFDLSGRKLFSESGIHSSKFQISSKQFGTQVLVVKVKTENGVISNKKLIN